MLAAGDLSVLRRKKTGATPSLKPGIRRHARRRTWSSSRSWSRRRCRPPQSPRYWQGPTSRCSATPAPARCAAAGLPASAPCSRVATGRTPAVLLVRPAAARSLLARASLCGHVSRREVPAPPWECRPTRSSGQDVGSCGRAADAGVPAAGADERDSARGGRGGGFLPPRRQGRLCRDPAGASPEASLRTAAHAASLAPLKRRQTGSRLYIATNAVRCESVSPCFGVATLDVQWNPEPCLEPHVRQNSKALVGVDPSIPTHICRH